MGLLSFILDMLRRSAQGASVPAQQPGASMTGPSVPQPSPGQTIERDVERQVIPGTPLGFAVSHEVSLGAGGSLDRERTVAGLLGGCHHLITDYDHLGGRCPFCQAEAQELLAKGEIDLYTAHCQCLYCRDCKATCGACQQNTCRRHALQVQQADGSVICLCPLCAQDHQKGQLVQRVLGIVLGPFVSIPRPEQAKGASNDKA